MTVGFCTSVMNRRWQLERTLALNLAKLRGTGSFLALCDYNSQDDVVGLVRGFAGDIADGTLLFFRTDEPAGFHASKAKNLAHRLALSRKPDALFNLDCDNYLSETTLSLVTTTLAATPKSCLHNWTTSADDGTCGRIGMRTEDWMALGGYDETLRPTAFQDLDLLIRCRAAGLRYVLCTEGIPRPVFNSMAAKLAHLDHEERGEGMRARAMPGDANFDPQGGDDPAPPGAVYQQMYIDNVIISLGRPCRLPLSAQQRFAGTLNFESSQTI